MNHPERNQNEILAENLMAIMHRKNLSQNGLARKLDVSPTVVNKWCRGMSMPRNNKIDKICQVLNITRAELLQDRTAAPNLSVPAAHPVRILGVICAGEGITADENFRGVFFVDHSIRADYCLEVEGDSMKDTINAKWAPNGHPKPKKKAVRLEKTRLRMVRTKGLEPK